MHWHAEGVGLAGGEGGLARKNFRISGDLVLTNEALCGSYALITSFITFPSKLHCSPSSQFPIPGRQEPRVRMSEPCKRLTGACMYYFFSGRWESVPDMWEGGVRLSVSETPHPLQLRVL